MTKFLGVARRSEKLIFGLKILVMYLFSLLVGFSLRELSHVPIYLDPSVGIATALALMFSLRMLGIVMMAGGIFLFLFGPYEDKMFPVTFLLSIALDYLLVFFIKNKWTINLHFSGLRSLKPFIGLAVVLGLVNGMMARFSVLPLETLGDWGLNFLAESFSIGTGVLIFTPLTFLFIGPLEYWRPRARVLLLSTGILISIFLFISAYTRDHFKEVAHYDLNLRAKQRMENLPKKNLALFLMPCGIAGTDMIS